MKKENTSQFAILGLLSKSPEYSGYDIKSKLEKIAPFYWSENNAQIYPILKKLQKEGKVTSSLDASSGSRNKMVYKITNLGLNSLKEWLLKPANKTKYREELLLKIAIGEVIPKKDIINHLEEHLKELSENNKLLAQIINHIAENHENCSDIEYLKLTHEYSKIINEAKVKWTKLAIERINKH